MTADLGALLSRLLDAVIEREAPILREHGMSMWEYVILSALDGTGGLSQNELAERSRRDSTRLIRHLDELAGRDLVAREIDPRDRRRRIVTLTDRGIGTLASARRAIRRMEGELLAALSTDRQDELRTALTIALRGAAGGTPSGG